MRIILTFILNAVLNLVLGLLIARFLGPDDYGRYALAMAAALVINTLLLDWLKVSATRFYSDSARTSAPDIRASLDLAQGTISLGIIAFALALVISGVDLGLPAALVAATAAAGIATAAFDYQAALARARFHDGAYMRLVIVKNVVSFALMVGGAYLYREPAIVMAGFCLSVISAILLVRPALADPGTRLSHARPERVQEFARYGLPLVIANGIYQIIPMVNRAVAAAMSGFAEAGYFSLAADLGVRLVASVGSALDIFIFQVAVRADAEGGRAAARAQVRRNFTFILMLIAPFIAGYWLILPALEALVVPPDFRGFFSAYTIALLPALFAFAMIQYGLNPAFQIEKATAPVTLAALTGLGVDILALVTLPSDVGPLRYAYAQSSGMVAALLVCLWAALRLMPLMPALRDITGIMGGCATMVLLLGPWREASPTAALPGLIVMGSLIYGAIILAVDAGGVRVVFRQMIASRKAGAN